MPTSLVVKNGSNTCGRMSAGCRCRCRRRGWRRTPRQALLGRLALERHRLGRDRQRAAGRHGVARIDREIDQRELELARVDLDGAALVGNRRLDLDVAAQRTASKSFSSGRRCVRSITAALSICRREKVSNCRVRLSPRCVAVVIMSRKRVCFSSVRSRRSRCDAAAHDHQQIVEIVRHAAGQLADRLEPLGLPQRVLRGLAPVGFRVQPPRPLQREPDDRQTSPGRRQAEDQVARHRRQPFGADGGRFDASDDVDRKAGELAVADTPADMVDLRGYRVDAFLETLGDLAAQRRICIEIAADVFPLGIAGKKMPSARAMA